MDGKGQFEDSDLNCMSDKKITSSKTHYIFIINLSFHKLCKFYIWHMCYMSVIFLLFQYTELHYGELKYTFILQLVIFLMQYPFIYGTSELSENL